MGSKEQAEHDHGVAFVCASANHLTRKYTEGDVGKAMCVLLASLHEQHPDIREHPERYNLNINVWHAESIAHPEGTCGQCDEWRARDRAFLAEHKEA